MAIFHSYFDITGGSVYQAVAKLQHPGRGRIRSESQMAQAFITVHPMKNAIKIQSNPSIMVKHGKISGESAFAFGASLR